MAFDAPRKTLDDIRRELDAEFGEAAAANISSEDDAADHPPAADDDAVSVRRPPAAPPVRRMRDAPPVSFDGDDEPEIARHDAAVIARARLAMQAPRRRSGYIAAGVIGCLVGQLILLGFMAVARHRPVSAPGLESPMERVGATPLASTATPSTSSAATETETTAESSAGGGVAAPPRESEVPSAVAAATPPTSDLAVPETPVATSAPTPLSVPPAATSIPPATPPASIATPGPAASEPMPVPRRVVKRAPTGPPPPAFVVPSPSASPVRSTTHSFAVDSHNWAASQEEVRAALSHWLAASGRADQSIVSDTVVFLGADGRTARTHVPMRWGGTVVIREQRWVRGPRGWALVDDREAWQGR